MKKITLKFWGVRGSLARPGLNTLLYGGNTPCVEIKFGPERIILDAGTGIYDLGREIGKKNIRATLLFSHFHWDHLIGLPFFAPIFNPKNKFLFVGKVGLRKALNNLLMAPNFPVKLGDLTSKIKLREIRGGKFKIGKIATSTLELNHPNGGFGYRFNFPEDRSIVYLTDNGPSTDDTKLIESIYGASILIHDAQFTPDEFIKRKKFGHSTYNYVLDLAKKCNIKTVILFHHDPSHDDRMMQNIESHAIKIGRLIGLKSRVCAARDGMSVDL